MTKPPRTPTSVDITPAMLQRASVAVLAEEAQERLTDIYGHASYKRAERFARAALETALDLRYNE